MKTKLCVFFVVFVAVLTRGQGTLVYDQQSGGAPGGGGDVIQNSQPFGQSFTPTLSSVGFITVILQDVNLNNNLGATVYLNLLAGSISGTIIGSTTPISMPDNWGTSLTGGLGYETFYFPTPVSVTPGTTYYFQPVVQSGDSWYARVYTYNYSGGTVYVNGIPKGGTEDFWFQEGIVVPEPSPSWLVLLGSGALWFWRQRKFL